MSICLKVQDPNSHPNSFVEVDLDTATRTTVSYSIVDFLDLNKPQSFKSTEIRIAGTNKSNSALRSIFRVDVIDDSFEGTELRCRLEFNGIDILRGTGLLTINSVEYDADTDYHYYDCYLIGTRFNWITKLMETTLCDLDLGSFQLTDEVIENSWDRFGVYGTAFDHSYIGCTFAPVHYGSWIDTTAGPNKSITSEDLYPSVYIKHLVEAIFDQLTEFKISSKFFNSEFFQGLVMPFTSKSGVLTRELKEFNTIKAQLAILDDPQNPLAHLIIDDITPRAVPFYAFSSVFNNPEYFNGQKYAPQYGVQYRVTFEMHYYAGPTHTLGAPTITLVQDAVAGCPGFEKAFNTDLSDSITVTPGSNGSATLVWETCFCPTKKNYSVWIKAGFFGSGVVDFTMLSSSSTLTIVPISTTAVICPDPLVLSSVVPCVTPKELLDALTQMFGLIWDTDENTKTIYVEPDSEFYITGSHLDWSQKINNSRPISKRMQNRDELENTKYTYKMDDNDFWLKVEKDGQGDTPYYDIVVLKEKDLSGDPKTYENILFAPSVSMLDRDVMGAAGSPPEWIRMWKEVSTSTDPSYDYVPRIAYFGGIRNYNGNTCGFLYEGVQKNGFPHMWFINGYHGSEYSLAFNSNNAYGDYEDTGLVQKYWSEYVRIAKIGVVIQAEVFLTEKDITNLVFQRVVYVQHYKLGAGIYRLNTIREWDAEEGRALIELVLVSR